MTVEASPVSVKVSPLTRFIYTALVVVQAGILITGGAVRLTGSGLGCPTWPRCTPGSYTPVTHQAQGTLHSWIEFGNRLLTILLFIAIIAAVIGVIRLRNRYSEKRALNWLALTQIFGIVAQIVLGGITVLTHLNPATVGAHFLLSILLIGASLSLRQRMLDKPRFTLTATSTLLIRFVLALTAVVLIIGTVVTGTGPHAGDIQARRYHLNPQVISWIHADAVIALTALTFALILLLRATEDVAHRSLVVKQAGLFFLICLGQGLIGYIQYFTGLPEALVAAHLLGADLVWLGMWNLAFTGRALAKA